jgi:hypothetical protein
MSKHINFLWILPFVLFLFGQCTRTEDFGRELLAGDVVAVNFDEIIELEAITIRERPLNYYNPGIRAANRIFVGGWDSEYFGTLASMGHFRVFPTSQVQFEGLQIDSIVMILEYDTANYYGDTLSEMQLGVYLLKETLRNDSIYTTQSFIPFEEEPIGMTEIFIPRPTSNLITYDDDSVATVRTPRISVKLNDIFVEKFKSLSLSALADNNVFLETIPGFMIKPEIQSNALVSFRLRNARTGIEVYYEDSDGVKRTFQMFPLSSGGAAFSRYERSYENCFVEEYLNNSEKDDFHFIQGGQGLNLEIQLPLPEEIKGKSISFAQLEFIVHKLEDLDYEKFPQTNRILASRYINEEGLALISEATFAISTQNFSLFGGSEIEIERDGELVRAYRFNISGHYQRVLQGVIDNKIVLDALVSAEQFGHLTLYGKGSLYKPVLKLVYTD